MRPLIPGSWVDDALCAQVDPDLFFPDKGASSTAVQAQMVCRVCPVRNPCLEYAVSNKEQHGIWSGTTAKVRAKIGGFDFDRRVMS